MSVAPPPTRSANMQSRSLGRGRKNAYSGWGAGYSLFRAVDLPGGRWHRLVRDDQQTRTALALAEQEDVHRVRPPFLVRGPLGSLGRG